jgi:hypothetical protein
VTNLTGGTEDDVGSARVALIADGQMANAERGPLTRESLRFAIDRKGGSSHSCERAGALSKLMTKATMILMPWSSPSWQRSDDSRVVEKPIRIIAHGSWRLRCVRRRSRNLDRAPGCRLRPYLAVDEDRLNVDRIAGALVPADFSDGTTAGGRAYRP